MGAVEKADESFRCYPDTKYGKSKLEAENFIIDHSDEIDATILRLSSVYGKKEPKKRRLTQIIDRISEGKFIIFGKGDNLMPLLNVDDAVSSLILAGKYRHTGQVFIISGEEISMQELSDIITEYKKIRKTRHLPKFLGYLGGIFLGIIGFITRRKMPLTLQKFMKLIESRSFYTDKAKKELGWVPKARFRDAIKEII